MAHDFRTSLEYYMIYCENSGLYGFRLKIGFKCLSYTNPS